jgi:cell division protein FtsX
MAVAMVDGRRWAALAIAGLAAVSCSGDDGGRAGPTTTEVSFPIDAEVAVFFELDATDEEIDGVAEVLEDQPQVTDITFVDQEEALARFGQITDDSVLLEQVTADQLPASFEDQVDGGDDEVEAVRSAVKNLPGVREVALPASSGETVGFVTVRVFLHPTSTDAELRALGDELGQSDLVVRVELTDHQQAYEEFVELFSDDQELIDATRPSDLPPSVEVTADRQDVEALLAVACAYADDPRVREVAPQAPLDC